jgi:hypothetical protein
MLDYHYTVRQKLSIYEILSPYILVNYSIYPIINSKRKLLESYLSGLRVSLPYDFESGYHISPITMRCLENSAEDKEITSINDYKANPNNMSVDMKIIKAGFMNLEINLFKKPNKKSAAATTFAFEDKIDVTEYVARLDALSNSLMLQKQMLKEFQGKPAEEVSNKLVGNKKELADSFFKLSLFLMLATEKFNAVSETKLKLNYNRYVKVMQFVYMNIDKYDSNVSLVKLMQEAKPMIESESFYETKEWEECNKILKKNNFEFNYGGSLGGNDEI